jgi:hypothetical protein
MREVKAGSSYLGQNDLRQHFGLGDGTRAERLEVRWPSGRVDVVPDPPVDVIVTVREGSGLVGQPFDLGPRGQKSARSAPSSSMASNGH